MTDVNEQVQELFAERQESQAEFARLRKEAVRLQDTLITRDMELAGVRELARATLAEVEQALSRLEDQRDTFLAALREGRCPRCGEWFRDDPKTRAVIANHAWREREDENAGLREALEEIKTKAFTEGVSFIEDIARNALKETKSKSQLKREAIQREPK